MSGAGPMLGILAALVAIFAALCAVQGCAFTEDPDLLPYPMPRGAVQSGGEPVGHVLQASAPVLGSAWGDNDGGEPDGPGPDSPKALPQQPPVHAQESVKADPAPEQPDPELPRTRARADQACSASHPAQGLSGFTDPLADELSPIAD